MGQLETIAESTTRRVAPRALADIGLLGQAHAVPCLKLALPTGSQIAWTITVALLKKICAQDAISPEMPKPPAQLAPSCQQANRLRIPDDNRPDDALAVLRLLVSIANLDFAPTANPQAGFRDVQAICTQYMSGRRTDGRLGDERTQTFGDGRGNLGDQVACRAGKHRITALNDQLRAKNRSFYFIRRQHQRWHIEVAVEDIAQPRLALDRHSLSNQVGDIPVNGPFRHL